MRFERVGGGGKKGAHRARQGRTACFPCSRVDYSWGVTVFSTCAIDCAQKARGTDPTYAGLAQPCLPEPMLPRARGTGGCFPGLGLDTHLHIP